MKGIGRRTIRLSWLSAGCAAVGFSAVCQAQATDPSAMANPASAQSGSSDPYVASGTSAGGDDIVVTARRRDEQVSKVPLSVVALSPELIARKSLKDEHDLSVAIPGLVVKSGLNASQFNFVLRGQTLDPFTGSSPAVIAYVNEVPFSVKSSAPYFDLESIQVLKGPQGTLFGRNTSGGAVLYSTAKPGDDFGGYVLLEKANFDLWHAQGAIDIPISPETVALRVAGDIKKSDGFIRNINTGNTLGDVDSKAIRATLRLKPSEEITNIAVISYGDYEGTELGGQLSSVYQVGQTNNGFALNTLLDSIYGNSSGPPAPGRWPGGPLGYLAFQKANPYKTWLSYDLPHSAWSLNLSNTTTYDLGSSTIKNIFGYYRSYSKTPGILSGSPFNVINTFLGTPPGGQIYKNRGWSNELQLQGKAIGSQLDYIVGVFLSSDQDRQYIPGTIAYEFQPNLGEFLYHHQTKNRSRAVYGQATYSLSGDLEGVNLTAGLRYTWERVTLEPKAGHLFLFTKQVKHAQRPSWTASIDYSLSPSSLIYFTTRGSWRVGGFNGATNPAGNQNAFANERTHDFEAGYKFSGNLLGAPSSISVAAYRQLVSNVQRAVFLTVNGAPSSSTGNVPKARIDGLEIGAETRLAPWLSLGLTGAYTDAQYTDRRVVISGNILNFSSYPDTPRLAGSISADITIPTPSEFGTVDLHGEMYHQSGTYFGSLVDSIGPDMRLKGYQLVNVRLKWGKVMQSRLDLSLYVKNLLDHAYYQAGYQLGPAAGLNTVIPGAPRTFGIEGRFSF